jgi:hypothetical protein
VRAREQFPKYLLGTIARPQSLSNQETLETGGSWEQPEFMYVVCRSVGQVLKRTCMPLTWGVTFRRARQMLGAKSPWRLVCQIVNVVLTTIQCPPPPHIAPPSLSAHESLWTEIPYYTVFQYTVLQYTVLQYNSISIYNHLDITATNCAAQTLALYRGLTAF